MKLSFAFFVSIVIVFACANSFVFAAAQDAAKTAAAKPASVKTAATKAPVSKFERLAMAMLPQEKLKRAEGFFGPVVKKYMPTFNRFQAEFQASKDKRAVVTKYLPDAEAALSEAKAMKVPQKYENEKAEYIQMAETFMSVLRVTVALGK